MRRFVDDHVCNDGCREETVEDYWCAGSGSWSMCPEPCDKGPHEPRSRQVFMHRLEPTPGACGDPECHVLHADTLHPIHPPDYVDSRR